MQENDDLKWRQAANILSQLLRHVMASTCNKRGVPTNYQLASMTSSATTASVRTVDVCVRFVLCFQPDEQLVSEKTRASKCFAPLRGSPILQCPPLTTTSQL
jgi:hypothetical protein